MPKLLILPNIEDIKLFKTGGEDTSNNDEYNKIRENIIANLLTVGEEYLDDPIWGHDWRMLKEKFLAAITPLAKMPFHNIKIKQMGGMSYNYDFLVSFMDQTGAILQSTKLEFKHNNTDVSNLVQFLELYDKDCKAKFNICSVSYAEFYYDNYLDHYLALEDDPIEKPAKDVYLKNVFDIKYKHPFFRLLYEKKGNKTKEKKVVANDSVKRYIELYNESFQFDKICEKIKESQTDKVFLLWDCENFHTQVLDVENVTIQKIQKVDDMYFDVETAEFQYDIRVRIRWANNNGLANPTWKFTFIQK